MYICMHIYREGREALNDAMQAARSHMTSYFALDFRQRAVRYYPPLPPPCSPPSPHTHTSLFHTCLSSAVCALMINWDPSRWWSIGIPLLLRSSRGGESQCENSYMQYSFFTAERGEITNWEFLSGMGWLRLVGSLNLQVSFAKEPYKRDDILQKRPIIFRSLLIVTTQ